MTAAQFIKLLSAEICGILGFLWGDLDGLLLALVSFMVLDYVTGLIVGAVRHALSSSTGFTGLARKGLILLIVAVAHILDTQVLGGSVSVCRSAVIGFYLANEGLSILENAGNLGLPLPQKLRRVLEQLRDNDKEDDK
ncbi:MAG: phage holin family protein [Oscillospiraceae bacterium]|nr:phage holin family protein [Oscillospiraceae bacterium]